MGVSNNHYTFVPCGYGHTGSARTVEGPSGAAMIGSRGEGTERAWRRYGRISTSSISEPSSRYTLMFRRSCVTSNRQ
jgi:hypothetical protein